MAEPIEIGLDFGSLGCRAACLVNEEIVEVPLESEWSDTGRWLTCELSPDSLLGVQFRTVKSRLGVQDPEAEGIVREMLRELRREATRHADRPVTQIVAVVPAMYSSVRRTALRDLALEAGFTDAHLLNDGMAAAIGHAHRNPEPRTLLVITMGYSGSEVALIRAAKGHYRALGYEGTAAAGGAAFDAIMMRGCLQALVTRRRWSAAHEMPPKDWLAWREMAQKLKDALSHEETVELRIAAPGESEKEVVPLRITRSDFEQAIANGTSRVLEAGERVLEIANLAVSDVDEILLAGGSSSIPVIRRLFAQKFLREPALLDAGIFAQGAAIYASRLGLLSAGETGLAPRYHEESTNGTEIFIPVVNVLFAQTDSASEEEEKLSQGALPGRPSKVFRFKLLEAAHSKQEATTDSAASRPDRMDSAMADRQKVLNYARRLVEQGSPHRAAGFLQGLIDDAQALLSTIPGQPSALIGREAAQILQNAYDLLEQGRLQQAVEFSHHAYALDPENPAVFQKMIDVHCRAGMADTSIDGYSSAMLWLKCALGHDRTNTSLHDRIAERHYLHACQKDEAGYPDEALQAAQECLYFNPEHEGAEALKRKLENPMP